MKWHCYIMGRIVFIEARVRTLPDGTWQAGMTITVGRCRVR